MLASPSIRIYRGAEPQRTHSQDVDMVTARINYRFGGPVVAKY